MNLNKLILFLSFCLGCSYNPSSQHPGGDKLSLDTATDTYSVTDEDPSMNLAIEYAKKTISEFDQALKSNNTAYTDFAVKKRYKTSDGGGEHMWIARISLVNGNYQGFVNNDAEKTNEVKYGDTVLVHKREIIDWMYLDNNVLRGGYTIREIRNQMNTEDRNKFDKESGFKIED